MKVRIQRYRPPSSERDGWFSDDSWTADQEGSVLADDGNGVNVPHAQTRLEDIEQEMIVAQELLDVAYIVRTGRRERLLQVEQG